MIKNVLSMVAVYFSLVIAIAQTWGISALGPVTYTLLIIPSVILGYIAMAIMSKPSS